MLGRKLISGRRLLALIGTGICGAALLQVGGGTRPACAQEPIPKLPPTKVEAQPTPGETPIPAEPFPGEFPSAPPSGAPIGSGGIFASPLADGYRAESSTTGTIVNVPNLDIPGTITVVPSGLIADQQAINVDDILRDIPGAVKGGFEQTFRPNDFILRGFEIDARDWRWNGYQDFSPAPRDFFNVQRYEILQGPGSVLYGSGQPSGVVNVITKQAFDGSLVNGAVQTGSFGLIRTTADVNGVVAPELTDGKLLIRVNFGWMNTESFRDFGHEDRVMVDPVLTYVIDDRTALSYEFQYMRDRRLFDTGVAALGGTPTSNLDLINNGFGVVGGNVRSLPTSTFLGQPTDFQEFQDYKTSLTFLHKLDDDWSMKIGGFLGWHDSPNFGTVPTFFGNDPVPASFGLILPNNVLLRTVQSFNEFAEQNVDFVANLAGKVTTGPITHHLVFGAEYDYFKSVNSLQTSDPFDFSFATFSFFPVSPINALNPATGYTYTNPPITGGLTANVYQSRTGMYAQDLMDVGEYVKVLAGVRYDIVWEEFTQVPTGEFTIPVADGGPGISPLTIDEHSYFFSPRVGIVVQPIKDVVALYGLYSESFDPAASGIFVPGTQLRPETGRTVEGGFKADLLNKRLSIAGSGFYIVKDNVVTQVSSTFSEQIGEQRAQGCELSAVGKLSDRWSIVSNYAYVDSRIVDGSVVEENGVRFRGVPYNSANVWSRYNVIQDCRQTLGGAVGMVYVGDRTGDLIGSFDLPAYTRWDAGLYYTRGPLSASLYFENIGGAHYYTGSLSNLEIFPGAPFTFRALVGVTF